MNLIDFYILILIIDIIINIILFNIGIYFVVMLVLLEVWYVFSIDKILERIMLIVILGLVISYNIFCFVELKVWLNIKRCFD